jgi:hypothetical protein
MHYPPRKREKTVHRGTVLGFLGDEQGGLFEFSNFLEKALFQTTTPPQLNNAVGSLSASGFVSNEGEQGHDRWAMAAGSGRPLIGPSQPIVIACAHKRKPRSGEAGLSDGDECLGDYSSISRRRA